MRLFYLAIPIAASLVRAGHYNDSTRKTKENIHSAPHGWVRQHPAPPDHLLALKIALPQPHFPILEHYLWEVSDPSNERYGAYLSKEDTNVLMAPHPEALDAVSGWLSSYGIEEEDLRWSSAQDWVTVHVPVALAEEMLDTKYHVYTHSNGFESIVRTTSYSLPESVNEHVELIQPTTMFNRRKPLKSIHHWSNTVLSSSDTSNDTITGPAGNQVDASCNHTITISCLRQIYNAVGYNTSATNGNKIAVAAFYNDSANYEDLQKFYQWQNPAAYGSNYTFVSIHGAVNNQSADHDYVFEANIDAQFAFGLTYPTPAITFSTGSPNGLTPFIPSVDWPENYNVPWADFLDYMLSLDSPPQTISIGFEDGEQTVPFTYATRVCNGFCALGARGVSILLGSGDGGVASGYPAEIQTCLSNDGKNRIMFLPDFPASCPYVTSVGGTTQIPEIAANLSGGGFSNYFPQPSYQSVVVNKYLEKLAPGVYDGLYNRTGRAFPDVAAQSIDFQIIYHGKIRNASGTSCSAPTFAALISMANDARINAGMPSLGFLNQWLYQKGHLFLNDITEGNNPGCKTQGFNATTGWDPLTGLGTPNFQKLLVSALGNHY